ncbi:MAG: efflux RND transporter periplasmic adaptor subunit [Pseudomonadota bacterium]
MKKRLKIIIPVLLLLIIGMAVKTFIFPSTFYYAGTIEATKVDISARVGSVINEQQANEGDKVQKGQTLMLLDCEDIKIAALQANKDYERAMRLFKQGSMPLENYEHSKSKYDDLKLRLDWCTIKSPISGKVLARYREPGEFVQPGAKLFTLADLDQLWANIYVAAPSLAKLKLGQKVIAYLPEMNMKEFVGTIHKISDEAEFTPKNVQTREERTRLVYAIKIMFDKNQEILKPGMSVEAKIPD